MDTYNKGILFQASIMESLKYDIRKGATTIGQLLNHGDTGFGTICFPGGEMIIVDGTAYLGEYDGGVSIVSEEKTVPFGFSTSFCSAFERNMQNVEGYDLVKRSLDSIISQQTKDLNCFYMICASGEFSYINLRTGRRSMENGASKSNHRFTKLNNINGTVVGLYSPNYTEKINQPGWHMHFISKDKDFAGHVADISIGNANVSFDPLHHVEIEISSLKEFTDINF